MITQPVHAKIEWMTDHRPNISERLSAFVALASLAGAVVVLVVGTIVNVGAVVMILVGLIVAIIGSWDLLTRRGAIRFVAAGVAVIGLGLVVGGFAWGDLSVGRVVVGRGPCALVSGRGPGRAGAKRIGGYGQRSTHAKVPLRPIVRC